MQQLRSFDNLYLLKFNELALKGIDSFRTATNWLLGSKLQDHRAQFFTRQIVYENSFEHIITENFSAIVHTEGQQLNIPDHTEYTMIPSQSEPTVAIKERLPIQGLVPSIGPLHISLNAQETVLQIFHDVFKHIYENVFPHSKLVEKPKPWRTSLILEMTYDGWLLIRDEMTAHARTSRSFFSSILTNLLDNYLPLVLSIYAISFNKFKEYEHAVVRIWTMFLNFKRRHHNKSPLAWLSQILHWQQNNVPLYSCVSSNIAAIDDYRVENTHSIIKGNTNSSDTPEQQSRKAKALFAAKSSMFNIKSNFSPPKITLFPAKS